MYIVKYIPSLSGRVQRGLEPAEITRLEVIVDADEGQLSLTGALVDVDGGMAAVVPSGNGDTLGFEVHKGLQSLLSSALCVYCSTQWYTYGVGGSEPRSERNSVPVL